MDHESLPKPVDIAKELEALDKQYGAKQPSSEAGAVEGGSESLEGSRFKLKDMQVEALESSRAKFKAIEAAAAESQRGRIEALKKHLYQRAYELGLILGMPNIENPETGIKETEGAPNYMMRRLTHREAQDEFNAKKYEIPHMRPDDTKEETAEELAELDRGFNDGIDKGEEGRVQDK